MPEKPNWYIAATLAVDHHIYCAGTLAQCVRRWQRLSELEKRSAVIRQGRDGVGPAVLDADKIAELAALPGLQHA